MKKSVTLQCNNNNNNFSTQTYSEGGGGRRRRRRADRRGARIHRQNWTNERGSIDRGGKTRKFNKTRRDREREVRTGKRTAGGEGERERVVRQNRQGACKRI